MIITNKTSLKLPAVFCGSILSVAIAQGTVAAGFEIEEIVVTAQKRSQSLQEVPISETVLNEDDLKNARIESGTEIARQAPNLQVSVLGNEMQPKFSMRGISTKEFNLNGISPTGVFFDEVYVGASYLGGAQIFDIERIEVLRGPQGTLFGKNTTAGAINFISKRPTFESEAYITGGVASNDYWELKGAAEVPLIDDKLSARLAFNLGDSDGYVENLNPDGEDLSSIDRKSFRLTLGYRVDDTFDTTLRLFRTESNPKAVGAITYGLLPGGVNAVGVNPRINPFDGTRMDSHELATDRSGDIEVLGEGGYLTLEKDLGFATLTSITSHVSGEFSNLVDADGTMNNILHLDFGAEHEETSQDLRLSSNGEGGITWIAGLYYFKDVVDIATTYHVLEEFGGPVLGQSYRQTRQSYAVYFDGTYDIGDIFTLYGGLRLSDDEGYLEDFQVTPVVPLQSGKVGYEDSEPTGRVGVRLHLADESMLYAQFAYGYRSSAINGGALSPSEINVADPEKIKAYEVGYKSQWLDRRLTINSSLFYYDFTDQQFLNVVNIGQQQLLNAGSSKVTGLEVEVALQATENLRFNAGLGLLDSEYEDLVLNGVDLSGNELIEAPKMTFNVSGDYLVYLGDNGSINFHADANYVGSQYFHATNADEFKADSFWDVGARIAYRSPSEKYELSIYGKNLTDNDEVTGVETDANTATRFTTVPFPRRFGIDFTVNF
ncbi:TonB-dependent receptor [Aestuariicella hydrocarbonica]|uniref:TonB-dependent receptor n=1 Tax=Pseudomaricurvus hydrocarbonicus TaxID=1470433 RepID=A0A9E5JRM2_9GAMM|nr:TonB-dependent receptor [Aestuariicella hydrocarbonica]NHO64273.1 TonB-dependent receptor [Aestuariicella hydrocarbonica]